MRLALVQNHPLLGAVKANCEDVRRLLKGIECDLMLLPELFATGYYFENRDQVRQLSEPIPDGPTTRFLVTLAREKNAHVCAGLPELVGKRRYNSAVLVGPQGHLVTYRKLHLFYEEKCWFSPGEESPPVVDLGTARVGLMVCYDWRYPEVARILALQGAQVLLHPANLVHPYCQDAMITRCLENRVFAATANRIGTESKADGDRLTFTGRSQVVSPRGEVLVRAKPDEATVLTVDIEPSLADDKMVTKHNHLWQDRHPETYRLIAAKHPGTHSTEGTSL